MIICQKFRYDVVEMLLTKNHKMIQALLLKRLHISFDVGICICRQLPLIVTVRIELFG